MTKPRTLITADQLAVEALALKLVESAEVGRQKEATLNRFLADPAANTVDGKRTLQNAVDQMVYAMALGAANSDSSRPKIIWAFTAPYEWSGQKTPGSYWCGGNPDNVFLFAIVDGASQYEITVYPKQPVPAQFNFMLYDTFAGEGTKKNDFMATTIGGLRDQDIKTEADGSFKITIDNDPANGRVNHIQSNADVRNLMIRNTFTEWGKQNPLHIEIRRVGGPEAAKPATEKDLAQRAADLLKVGAESLLLLKNDRNRSNNGQANVLAKPVGRGGNFGFLTYGFFRLSEDEALLVTVDPLGAKYLSFTVLDPWLIPCESVRGNGSLNNLQSQPNNDGSYTYVISAKDPGICNWLDTDGLREGKILLRWQAQPETIKSADDAVRDIKVVKFGDLSRLLPPETVKVSLEQRKHIYAQRALAYAHRFAGV